MVGETKAWTVDMPQVILGRPVRHGFTLVREGVKTEGYLLSTVVKVLGQVHSYPMTQKVDQGEDGVRLQVDYTGEGLDRVETIASEVNALIRYAAYLNCEAVAGYIEYDPEFPYESKTPQNARRRFEMQTEPEMVDALVGYLQNENQTRG